MSRYVFISFWNCFLCVKGADVGFLEKCFFASIRYFCAFESNILKDLEVYILHFVAILCFMTLQISA